MTESAFFPLSECVVSTGSGRDAVAVRVRGASIVNRFPYVIALSLNRRSSAHRELVDRLERTGAAAIQLGADASLSTRACLTAPIARLNSAYLVYEAVFPESFVDGGGETVYASPWVDVHDRRIYFLEIRTIQLREDIASGRTQIAWTALPGYTPGLGEPQPPASPALPEDGYVKPYTSDYRFPARGTVAFEPDEVADGFAVKRIESRSAVSAVSNDDARWPCFFPASVGMIASRLGGAVNVMPCGSTTVVCDRPLTIAPCIAYAAINERYRPRATLSMIEASGRFTCGVPFSAEPVLDAIRFAGNSSLREHPSKAAWSERATLAGRGGESPPQVPWLPINFECEVAGSIPLGTHVMLLGTVRSVSARASAEMSWSSVPTLVRSRELAAASAA
ncbi:MAG TPA: flavin reductase [Thermoleophilaceae bacterium]